MEKMNPLVYSYPGVHLIKCNTRVLSLTSGVILPPSRLITIWRCFKVLFPPIYFCPVQAKFLSIQASYEQCSGYLYSLKSVPHWFHSSLWLDEGFRCLGRKSYVSLAPVRV